MRRDVLREALQLNMEHRRRKWWHRVVSMLAAVVVFITTYALILPAITMEQDTICGLTEHTHSDACIYTPVQIIGRDMQCTAAVHVHDESCCDSEGNLVCGRADFIVHQHEVNCYDHAGNLVCKLQEIEEHIHTDDCYERTVVYLCDREEGDGAHTHGDTCYTIPELTCTLDDTAHMHDAACYAQAPLVCLEPEIPAHEHGDSCYVSGVLLCEAEVHEHTDGCYASGELLCEAEVHAHEDACFAEPILICQTEQTLGHAHGDSCYGEPELICQEPTVSAHIHSSECYSEKELICILEEQPGHIHDDTCATETISDLICQETEVQLHSHTDDCYTDRNPDSGSLVCCNLEVLEHRHGEACFADHIHTEACYELQEEKSVLICPYHVHEATCYDADQLICIRSILICEMDEHSHTDSCYPEVDDGMTEVTFEIPGEYAAFVQHEITFPFTLTLEDGTTLESGNIPVVTVVNPDEENPVYLPDYHWVTSEGYPLEDLASLSDDTVLTLRLYAAEQPEAARLVTATFVNNGETILSRTVNFGTVVSDLLTEQILQTLDEEKETMQRFEGWQFVDASGELVFLESGSTVIEADTTYTAAYREYVSLTLHDLDPDGQEYPGSPQQVYLPAGESLCSLQILLGDGSRVEDCLWYTHSGEPFALDAQITDSLHLYTYSYTLFLNMESVAEEEFAEPTAPEAVEEATSEPIMFLPLKMRTAFAAEADAIPLEDENLDGETPGNVSIVKRRGVALTESDFLVDGVNYTDYQWQDDEGNDVDASDLVGTSLTSNYALTRAASADYSIRYNINVQHTVFGTSPTVGGQTSLEDFYNTDDGSYTIRVPNPTQYMVTNGNKRTLYTFSNWKVSRDSSTISAGETVDASWISKHVNYFSKYVTLTAQWAEVPVTETVHFFVNLNCQVADVEGNSGVPSSGDFTPSVYSTLMTITGNNMKRYWRGATNAGSNTQYVVLRADNAKETEKIDTDIRRLITGYDTTNVTYNGNSVWASSYSGVKIFQVDDFPSDEQVLAVVRNMVQNGTVIKMNNVPLKAEDLTANNFTVRWNVCKYDSGDGWHIDGILVGKQAHITVKKTFLGDDAAVQAVKDGDYSITLDNTTSTAAADLTLTLNPAAEENGSGKYGYNDYDSASDTYTWVVPLQQENHYSVIENRYKSTLDAVQTSAVYTVSNSPEAFSGWEPYPDNGIPNIRAYAYASDVSEKAYQTVMIRNSYVKSDTLTINKIDMDTGNGLGGVSYRIKDSLGEPLTLYQKPGTSYYSMKSADLDNGFIEINDSVITTDRNGSIFLKLDSGIFTLEEAFPTGYGGASKITVIVGVDSSGSVVFDEVSSSDSTIEVDGTLVDKNTATLTIRNVSFPTTVTAQKVWNNSADSKPVSVALMRNGVDMGSEYQAVLNASNGWTHTWQDLPLYVDGAVAKYSLREIKIGNINYDPSADSDGYAGYIVSYDEMIYQKNGRQVEGPIWTDSNGITQYADNAHLTVRNEVYRGQMMFLKVDGDGKPLPGALFRLYSDAQQKTVVAEATSDEYGRVIFENLMPDTYYVMKEANTPEGYVGGDSLYKIRLTSQGSTTLEDNTTGEVLTAVVNYLDMATVEVLKQSSFGTVLPDVQFRLDIFDGQNWSAHNTGQTDASGKLVLGELRSGTYRLTETRAPDGFMPLPASITFTVDQGELQISNPHELWSAETDEANKTTVITVINESGYVLPKTGGSTVLPYYTAGFTMIFAALILLLIKRRKGVPLF